MFSREHGVAVAVVVSLYRHCFPLKPQEGRRRLRPGNTNLVAFRQPRAVFLLFRGPFTNNIIKLQRILLSTLGYFLNSLNAEHRALVSCCSTSRKGGHKVRLNDTFSDRVPVVDTNSS